MDATLRERDSFHEDIGQPLQEEVIDLFVIRTDAICAHVLEYIQQMDVSERFRVHDVDVPNARPHWLHGVPTVVFRPEVSDGKFGPPEGHVGEDALRYIRECVEGPQEQLHNSQDPDDDLEVIDAGGGSGGISTYDMVERRDPLPDDEGQLLHFLLPLPSSLKTGPISRIDVKATEEDIKRAIEDRGRAFSRELDEDAVP
jgi:hypothetical protein